ncbi:Fmu (Sun) domain-containing protein [Paraflavitalea sp. CAU 1676]|uniref:Fmu (Sun) domain-containing protein n=1 Tax=Paraflavitalea sp. CAU 1676 TaxID=3032598 RepID=UPI0023DA6028|nr:Fmu (Sun) domain-containing protein [Paraflavitalea sp. CAU 1676]MDF2189464.1 Fmu (Sun) domain-containing protein [Paraflavitalea sp. CAU 1676]
MKFFAHLNTAVQVLDLYKGQQPFGIFIKEFFRQDKKYGSRDRKSISHLCYCYFRLGKALRSLPAAERVVSGLFLCSLQPNEMLAQLKPAWNEQTVLPLADKWNLVLEEVELQEPMELIFPWKDALSDGIDANAFGASFLVQPDLFIRCRPGKQKIVEQKLQLAGISYSAKENGCLALPNGTKVEEVIALNKEAVVQDYSSQQVGGFLQRVKEDWAVGSQGHARNMPGSTNQQRVVWDCCAASGGKSILAWDTLGSIDLTVSDIRESIIANLRQRFSEAGIASYHSLVADLSDQRTVLPATLKPSLIIADVPCSGSGTWSRTPEQLYNFEESAIARYQALQLQIVGRVQAQLPSGGYFLYITCSVFRAENEAVVAAMQERHGLDLLHMEVLKGYGQRADTMFAALLNKS